MKKLFLLLLLVSPISIFSMSYINLEDAQFFISTEAQELLQQQTDVVVQNFVTRIIANTNNFDLVEGDISPEECDARFEKIWNDEGETIKNDCKARFKRITSEDIGIYGVSNGLVTYLTKDGKEEIDKRLEVVHDAFVGRLSKEIKLWLHDYLREKYQICIKGQSEAVSSSSSSFSSTT